MGAGRGVDRWRLVAERGVSPAVVVVRRVYPGFRSETLAWTRRSGGEDPLKRMPANTASYPALGYRSKSITFDGSPIFSAGYGPRSRNASS